jgi:hypothetical protein
MRSSAGPTDDGEALAEGLVLKLAEALGLTELDGL